MQRQQQITEWLFSLYPGENFTLAPASADASFRRYFRASFSNRSLIVMDAPPQHEDCKPFLHVGKLFAGAGVNVPLVHAQDLEQGFLLLSDLGSTTYLQALNGNNAAQLYTDATDALIKIQLASCENELPQYDEALLRRELALFPEWYISRHLGVTLTKKQSDNLDRTFNRIIANNLAQPRVYVHRDYHSRNLMLSEPNGHTRFPHLNPLMGQLAIRQSTMKPCKSLVIPRAGRAKRGGRSQANEKINLLSSPGILDFQDAVYGPITYDLASLFKDAYIKWDEEMTMDWIIRYWEKARKAGLPVREDFGEFYRDYELMGAQRHIKVLGIFARLYHRDGKDGYLKDMPLVMEYLRRACERYIDLKPLLKLLMELEQQKQS
jgi:aminoglycoside/choline kinase family phosphotransferase